MSAESAADEPFWRMAERFLSDGRAERGTLMGFDCLRARGDFVATTERRTGHLIVKLTAERVSQLVADGVGQPFAPAGRVFREWVAVANQAEWPDLLAEAVSLRLGQ